MNESLYTFLDTIQSPIKLKAYTCLGPVNSATFSDIQQLSLCTCQASGHSESHEGTGKGLRALIQSTPDAFPGGNKS